MLTPFATWTGTDGTPASGIISAEYTCSHGAQPSVATLTVEFAAVSNVPNYGTLVITDGASSITLNDCRVPEGRQASERGNGSFQILDRRWRWKYHQINGHFNERDEFGRIRPQTLKQLPDLIAALLTAMGEDDYGYKMDAFPEVKDNALPTIDWDNANAAQELESLIQPYGFRVVYQPTKDAVYLAYLGEGADLPAGAGQGETRVGEGVKVPQAPEKITLVGAKTCFTAAILLEAVGMEPNGEIKLIDDLSYKPKDGWHVCPPPHFPDITVPTVVEIDGIKAAKLTKPDYVALAKECVYRWYRITTMGCDRRPLQIDGFSGLEYETGDPAEPTKKAKIDDILQIELLDSIHTNDADIKNIGQDYTEDARCYAIYSPGEKHMWSRTRIADNQVDIPFAIDPVHRLVKFDIPIYMHEPTHANFQQAALDTINGVKIHAGDIIPATVILVTSVHLRYEVTLPQIRYKHTIDCDPKNGDGTMILPRDDVGFNVYRWYDTKYFLNPKAGDAAPVYGSGGTGEAQPPQPDAPAADGPPDPRVVGYKPDREDRIEEDVDNQADALCKLAKNQFLEQTTWERNYDTIVAIDPDGKIQQVTWRVGGATTLTTASSNTEHVLWLPPFEDRQLREKLVLLNEQGSSIFEIPRLK